MTSTLAVMVALLTYWMLPPDTHNRAQRISGRVTLAVDERVVAWWQSRGERTPGQPRTTRLLQMVISELTAGIITGDAFVHVLGPQYATPEALVASPPTVDARVWHDVAHVWAASDEAGFSLAHALQRIHDYALVDQEVTREVQSTAAAPKFGLLTVIAMPVMSWMLAGSLGADPLAFLLHNPFGWGCCIVGLVLYATAAQVMRAMTRRAMA